MVQDVFVLADIINGLNVFRETQPVVIFEVGVIIDCLFEALRVVVDEDGVLLDFVSVDFEELDFRILLDYFVDVRLGGLVFILLFHLDHLNDLSTYKSELSL